MNGIDRAIWEFARERFTFLARGIAKDLRLQDASGIYGDDEGSRYGDDYQLNSLWDEYCHEMQNGPHEGLESAWDQTIRPFVEQAINILSSREQVLLSLATDEGCEFDPDSSELPPICRDGLVTEIVEALAAHATNCRIGSSPGALDTSPSNSFSDIRAFLVETKAWKPSPYELDDTNFSIDLYDAAITLIEKVVDVAMDRVIGYIDWRDGLSLPGDAGYRADEDLPINSWPLNLKAKRCLQEAGLSPNPHQLYLVQLLNLGFERELPIPGQGHEYRPELELAAGQLYAHDPNPAQVMRWLLSNADAGDISEQNDTLESALENAGDWREAAQSLMEWFYDLKASEDPYYR